MESKKPYLLLLLLLATGCGSLNTSKDSIDIVLPKETEVKVLNWSDRVISFTSDSVTGVTTLILQTGPDYFIEVRDSERGDSTWVRSVLNPEKGSRLMLIPDKIVVDAHDRAHDSLQLIVHSVPEHMIKSDTMERRYRWGDYGILVGFSFGLRFEVYQNPALPNDYGIYLGYHLTDELVLMLSGINAQALSYSEGAHSIEGATESVVSTELRLYSPFPGNPAENIGIFGGLAIGYADIRDGRIAIDRGTELSVEVRTVHNDLKECI